MRKARVLYEDLLAGMLWQDEYGYHFQYDSEYLNTPVAQPISLRLPLKNTPYKSNVLFPFFEYCKLTPKQQSNIILKMQNAQNQWRNLIDNSFVNQEFKVALTKMIQNRMTRLGV